MLAAGVAFASVTLLIPGVALLAVVAVAVLWSLLAGWGARAERASLPARLVEGAAFEVRVALRAGLLPLSATLVDPALGQPRHVRAWRPRGRIELTCDGVLEHRGRHQLPPPGLRLGDPLGIAAREISGRGEVTITVLPRIEQIEAPGGGQGRALGAELLGFGEPSRSIGRESPSEPDLDGLRPYRAGTPASRIYWPALARGDELLELRLTPPGGTGPAVVVDAFEPASPDALDRAVRAAASLCVHLARRGGCELLLPAMRKPIAVGTNLESWPEAHVALALVAADHGTPHPAAISLDAPVFWVSARAGAVGVPPAARGYLVSPAAATEPGGRPVAFTVAGCNGHALEPNRRTRPALAVVS